MLVAFALVTAALLGQAEPGAGAPSAAEDATPPVAPADAVPPPPQDSTMDGSVELGIAVTRFPGDGDLEELLTAGFDYLGWHLGPARAGVRIGAMLGGTHGACPEGVECAFAGFYAGAVLRIAPFHARAVSPWVELGVTPFVATGLQFEDSTLVGIELPRTSVGLDLTFGKVRVGVSVFHAWTPFGADVSHGPVVMWGSTLRFAWE